MGKDMRWLQRLANFEKAFLDFERACGKKKYTKLERSGLIQTFEFTFELAWKTLQDLLVERGYPDILGPRPVLQRAFQDGLIQKGEFWMEMLKSRNMTTHVYEEEIARKIAVQIRKKYFPLLKKLMNVLQDQRDAAL